MCFRRRQSNRVRWLSLLLLLCYSSAARAAPPEHLSIAAPDNCPTSGDVKLALQPIFPGLELTTDSVGAADVVVQQDAQGIWVRFAGAERRFEDPGARCEERARQVAVFVALKLEPPRLRLRLPVVPRARLPPPRQSAWQLEAGPALGLAPGFGSSPMPLLMGGGARVRWGGALAMSAGVSLLSSSNLHYPKADAHELLFPIDAGARLSTTGQAWDVGAEMSLVAAPAYLKGRNLERTAGGFRVELGARAAGIVRWWATDRIGLFASENALFWPRPVALSVGNVGAVGHTPRAWLAAQLGLALRFR